MEYRAILKKCVKDLGVGFAGHDEELERIREELVDTSARLNDLILKKKNLSDNIKSVQEERERLVRFVERGHIAQVECVEEIIPDLNMVRLRRMDTDKLVSTRQMHMSDVEQVDAFDEEIRITIDDTSGSYPECIRDSTSETQQEDIGDDGESSEPDEPDEGKDEEEYVGKYDDEREDEDYTYAPG